MSRMIMRTSSAENAASSLAELQWFGETLAVRPVRPEQDTVDADRVGQPFEVLLVIGRHPDVAPEDVERILGKGARNLIGLLAQPLGAHLDQAGAVLDAGHLSVG